MIGKARFAAPLATLAQCFAATRGGSLPRMLTAFLSPLSIVLALSFSLMARADVRKIVNEGKVFWAGNPTVIYLNADGTTASAAAYDHLVLKFTDTSTAGSLTIGDTVRANARILVVGGGGAGGSGGGSGNNRGAGGGGGAGGYLYDSSVALTGGVYTAVVGTGGIAAAAGSKTAGGNGQASLFKSSIESLLEAFGGGGGGAESNGVGGDNLGSGGGGSRQYTTTGTTHTGGICTTGQGNNGGLGSQGRTAGGGGGAGGVGGDGTTANVGGTGGVGLQNDITGELLYYAGGGGGGTKGADSDGIGIGGSGGGGNGGGDPSHPTVGASNTGGGGGGGTLDQAGANGGSGVVIVRITQLVETKVPVPVIDDKTFNGENQIAREFGIEYTYVSGTTNATDVGEYTFVVKPGPDLEWTTEAGGGDGEKTVHWKIVPLKIDKPTATDHVYDETEKIGVTCTEDCAKFCSFDESSVTNATNGGTYAYSVSLKNTTNTVWKDDTTDAVSGTWTIAPAQVALPMPTATSFTYDSTEKSVFASLDTTHYELADGSVVSATDGGNYSYTLVLKGNTSTVTNYVWNTSSAAPYSGEWTITPAANALTVSMAGWRVNTTPNKPTISATWGSNTVHYAYGLGENAKDITDWVDDTSLINTDGVWTVIAMIDATDNWNGATNSSQFVMWDDPLKLFRDSVNIKIAGATGTLTNFPALVRISEERFVGFLYSRAGSDGSNLIFLDGDEPLPHEVDTWSTSGESLVWVRIPELPPEGKTITMAWNLKEGRTPPENDPKKVWSADYVGVWHMNEVGAGAVSVADASGHQNGMGHASSVVADGMFGKARGRVVTAGNQGYAVTVPVYSELDALSSGPFTVSGWVKITDLTKVFQAYLFARKNTDTGGSEGWGARFVDGGNANQLRFWSSGNSGSYYSMSTSGRFTADTWARYDYVVQSGTRLELYINGALVASSSLNTVVSGTRPFTIGGMGATSQNSTLNGYSDEVRLRVGAASAEWISAEYASVTNDAFAVQESAVVRDGAKLNYWLVEPAMDKTLWDAKDTPGVVTNLDKVALAFGGVSNIVYSVYDPTQTFDSPADITEAGFYRIVFLPTETEGYEPISYTIDIRVVKSQPYSDIVGNGGDSGRVLLMNNHIGESGHPDINYQGWFDADNGSGTAGSAATPTYWHYENLTSPTVSTFNLKDGTESILYAYGGRRLWHLVACRHGNTFPEKNNTVLDPLQNYLPFDDTYANRITEHDEDRSATRATSGQLVMQNTTDAAVYSSCFTNGIGTIYFDAVNGWCRGGEDYDNYKIVVEIATNTIYRVAPTDANSIVINTVTDVIEEQEVTTVVTNYYGNLEGQWIPVEMMPFKRDGTAGFVGEPKTDELTLSVTHGGTMDNFYRVIVPLDIAGPVRFRIRRVSKDNGYPEDSSSFILLDNIIASLPAMRGDLVSAGHYDAEKRGAQVLGWELVTSTPYPAAAEADLIARAAPVYTVNVGDGSTPDTSKFFASATMHYRWRYLSQHFSDWQTVDLNPSDGFKALSALNLPGRVGDVEYWFDYKLQAPFYEYVDYSGASNASIDYTEDRGIITNRLSGATFASGGTDWFFRLREGKSDYAGFDIVYSRGESAAPERVHMALAEDHVWRGFVQTKEDQTGTIKYHVEALGEHTEQFAEYAATTNFLYCTVDKPDFPVSNSLVPGNADSWSTLTLDAVTGYIMFQIDDTIKDSMALTIVHADYQNANGWSDALDRSGYDKSGKKVNKIFVGTSTTNAYKIGVSPSKQTFEEDFSDWGTMSATSETWSFPTGLTDIRSDHMHGRTAYETFASETNGLWDVGQGMWIAKKYRDDRENAGVALQMGGYGKGYLQFTDKDKAPRGLESVTFNARLTQDIQFDDFAYYFGGTEGMLNLQDYTFMARTAFDLKSNKDFTGNASLSVVANYLPNKGCYEARWEWLGNDNNAKRGQRLCLYRWNVVKGLKESELIIAKTNTVFDVNTVTSLANNDNQKFAPLFISVSNDVPNNCTWVAAGIRRAGAKLGDSPLTMASSANWLGVCFKDTGSKRLAKGSYGVLSANCPGVLARPEFSHTVQIVSPASGKTKDTFEDLSLAQVNSLKNVKNCANEDDLSDADYPGWNIVPERNRVAFTDTSATGIGAIIGAAPAQELKIYIGTAGRSDWGSKPYKTIEVKGFGGATTNVYLYTTKDCSVRFAVGNGISDIAIDSVQLKQWRGGNWNDDDVWPLLPAWADTQHRDKPVGHTNFVFTSAWVTNHTVLLSAKRAKVDEPSSIRSPLMDGFSDDSTGYVRGKGLGMISIGYANAQENAALTLQIATNGVDYTTIKTYDTRHEASIWTTITNYNFAAMTPAQRKSGVLNTYIGLHDIKGAMRIIVSPDVIAAVENETNPTRFGDVTITEISCTDEPAVDVHSWWGWNLRTVGGDADSEKMMCLGDFSVDVGGTGLSIALNNSVDSENCQISKIDYRDHESYIQHKPFIQTPTFTSNIVGEVSFKARKYSANDGTATIVLFGSTNASETDEGTWSRINGAVFSITNDWYETYSYKTDPGQNFKAFRLAVVGIDGISDISGGGNGGLPDDGRKPERVLLDELFVSEAVRARMGFKNVGCFKSDMTGLGEVPNVPSRLEQPLCGEAWGVQCEIYGAQLASDIDFDHTPRVKLHWFDKGSGVVTGGWSPWGYENWKDQGSYHKSAWLVQATDAGKDRYVYRSNLIKSPESVISMSTAAPTYVQYTLEVIFYTKGSSVPVTNFLSRTEWGVDGKGPEWYHPLDLNAQNGGPDGSFAAYNILDNVAPGWAWFNEVNVFGIFNEYLENSDENCQYVEIAQPPEADLSGWSVRILEAQTSNGIVVTNTLATFGDDGLEGTKDAQWIDPVANMVFRVIANQQARKTGQLKRSDGTLDGVWKLENTYLTNMSGDSNGDTTISSTKPFGLQLVRKSGIVEHEIVAMGTNWWNDLSVVFQRQYHPTNAVNFLNANMSGAQFFYVGMDDDGGEAKSLGVFQNNGSTNDWNNTMKKSPGRRNPDQYIDPDHPVPSGESILVYFSVSGDNILQWDGESFTNGLIMTLVSKGSQRGTNITYRVAPWYEVGSVTTNGVSAAGGLVQTTAGNTQPREYVLDGVGKGASNNVTVVAMAMPDGRLAAQYDVGEDNPYRDAIIDWLGGGTDLYGNPFADVDSGEIKLAEFRSMNNTFVTNMTLTEMYWLDMDPTVGKLALLGGMAEAPTSREVTLPGGATRKYLRMGVYMMITNENDVVTPPEHQRGANDFTTHWTPYALRGLVPGSNSLGYEQARDDWESATFKLTGLLINGKTNPLNVDNWMPLRWFVFREDSFTPEGLSRIEIEDPHSPDSIGYNTGWGQWWEQHGFSNPVYFWSIDTRLQPFGVEALKQENYYGD